MFKKMTMDSLAEILESDLSRAFEVKDQTSLHRYITLLTQNLVKREENDREHSDFREAIIRIEEGFKRMDDRFEALQKNTDNRFESLQRTMDARFEAVDKRFEAVDRRFDDMSKRFTMLFSFMSFGFVLLATLMSVYQFLS